MKNLLLLTFAGLGERHNVGAPTFWKTVEGFIAAGWKVWIVDVGTKEDTPLGERDYGDGLYIVRFNPPFLRETRIRKIGWFFGFANVFAIRHILIREAGRLINEQHLAADNTVVYGQDMRPSPGPNSADDENVENFQKKAGQIVQLCYNLIIRRSTPALAF